MKKWILVTASFGKDEFHDSASRLISQARTFRIFDEIIHVNERNIQQYAPYFSQRCDEYSLNSTKGFGFYSWKPEIVDSISRLFPLHGIAYIDAGCEMNNNSFTRFRLKKMLKSTKNGGFFHHLRYPESSYTKEKVLRYFSLNSKQRGSGQIQATWFFLSGDVGAEIAQKWFECVKMDFELIDDSTHNESSNFIQHRYDQSVLSCLIKSMGLRVKKHRPCFRPISFFSSLNCFFHPIWSSRNRSGMSIIST